MPEDRPILDKAVIMDALSRVTDPATGRPITDAGMVQHVAACDGYCSAKLSAAGQSDMGAVNRLATEAFNALDTRAKAIGQPLLSFTIEWLNAAGRVVHTSRFGVPPPGERPSSAPTAAPAPKAAGHTPIPGLKPTPQSDAGPLAGVGQIIAVGAGKGGVGKSTVAINLAVALARKGLAVGAMDADIYGPSFPTMLGLHALEQSVVAGKLQPFYVHGVKAITIGKLVDPDKPLIWRGPMAHGAFKQLAEQTDWGELDRLIIDLPPGTGDISLTLAQTLKLTGAVVVCTPQRVAQDDAARAAAMFKQLGIEVLGVVENMSYFVGDDGKEYDLFGRGGARAMAQRLGLPFLGEIPITTALRQNSDAGNPTANFDAPGSRALADALERLADAVEQQAALIAIRQGQKRPSLTIR